MYKPITEPMVVLGNAMKDAGAVDVVKKIFKTVSKDILEQAKAEAKKMRKSASEDVEAGLGEDLKKKLVKTIAGLFVAIAAASPAFANDLDSASTSVDSLLKTLSAPDMPTLTLKKDDPQRILDQYQQMKDKILETDPADVKLHSTPGWSSESKA